LFIRILHEADGLLRWTMLRWLLKIGCQGFNRNGFSGIYIGMNNGNILLCVAFCVAIVFD